MEVFEKSGQSNRIFQYPVFGHSGRSLLCRPTFRIADIGGLDPQRILVRRLNWTGAGIRTIFEYGYG